MTIDLETILADGQFLRRNGADLDGETLDSIVAGTRTSPDTSVLGSIGIDVDLDSGISGGDRLTGGTGSSDNLALRSNVFNGGKVVIEDLALLLAVDKNSVAGTAMALMSVTSARTITLDESAFNLGNAVSGWLFAPTVMISGDPAIGGIGGFYDAALYTNNNGSTRTSLGVSSFRAWPTIRADGGSHLVGYSGFHSYPTLSVINSGVTTNTAITGFLAEATVNAGVVLNVRTGLLVSDAGGAGTVNTNVGVDIALFSKGTLNIGLRNGSSTVFTESVATLTAVGNTITPNATVKRLDNTSGGSLTLTSTPTIPDGQSGQFLCLYNSSAQNVVLQDQGTLASSNLRLVATTITLGPRDSVWLMYSTTTGDWIQSTAVLNVL